jgi:hypothetical protein
MINNAARGPPSKESHATTPATPEDDDESRKQEVSIEERLNQHEWNPNPGEQLIGKIVEISERGARYGAYPWLLVLDDKDEAHVAVHCLRSGLLWPVVHARPSVGDRVGTLPRLERRRQTHSYVVAFEKATEIAPDWDRIATTQRERSKDDKPAETGSLDSAWPSPEAELA